MIQPNNSAVQALEPLLQHHRLWGLVPAAGSGSRMAAACAKQYLTLAGQPLLAVTLNKLQQLPLAGLIVAIAPEDQTFASLGLPVHQCLGGASRAESVLAGLLALRRLGAGEADYVLVHDAARPCVTLASMVRLIDQVLRSGGGGLLAVPAADTLKWAEAPGQSARTLERAHIWQAHTPQLFPLGLLQQALESALQAGVSVTDEASAMEWLGHSPWLVEDRRDNIKVTRPEDLALAEYLLQQQEASA